MLSEKRVFKNGKPIEKSVLLSIVLYVYGLNDLCREIIYRITFRGYVLSCFLLGKSFC